MLYKINADSIHECNSSACIQMMLTVARGGSLLLLCDLPLYTWPSCPTISNSSWTDGLHGNKQAL